MASHLGVQKNELGFPGHPSPRLILGPAQGAFRTPLTEDLATLTPGWRPLLRGCYGSWPDTYLGHLFLHLVTYLDQQVPSPHVSLSQRGDLDLAKGLF